MKKLFELFILGGLEVIPYDTQRLTTYNSAGITPKVLASP